MWQTRRNAISTGICLVGCLLLVLIQRNIPEPIGGLLASLIFVGFILMAGVAGGGKYGLAMTFGGIACALFFFNTPYLPRILSSRNHLLRLLSFTSIGLALSAVCELLQRAWKRIEDRQRRLEEEVRERERAQLAEQNRADEFMATLASIADGVIRTDCDGYVTFLNPVAEELAGWKTAEAKGQLLSDIFQIVSESTRRPIENPINRALKDGQILNLPIHSVLISKDGTERSIDQTATPIKDASGAVVGSVLVFRDITDKQRGQAALREIEQRYRAIGESIDYGVWVCDSKGRNVYASESFLRLIGLTQAEFSVEGWASVLHPDDAEATLHAWNEKIRVGGRWDREHRYRGIDGRWHHVLARGVPVTNEQGEITSWVGINLDISRLKQVEAELRDADRRKDEFLATLAHELRNPLAPISNSLQILKMTGIDAQTTKLTLEMMERQSQQLVRLVDDLLDVSRVMRGKIELRREQIDLTTVISRAVEMVQPLIESQGHKLEILLPPLALPLNADPIRLSQVIGNLLTNAAKYTEPRGHIRLSARQEENQAVLSVRDSGIGIAPEMLSHIFEIFVQADQSSTKSQGGLGIGLTLVRNLVEMHGGQVEAHSAGLGKGSEFSIRLPLATEPIESPKVNGSVQRPSSNGSSSGLRLLVVDDNQDAASSLATLLRIGGHEVQVAYSGGAALDLVKTYVPDLVLLDICMPTMDGFEVSRRIRKTAGLENTVLAALTGWGQTEDRRRTAEAGFDHHLVKPPEPGEIERILSEVRTRMSIS